MLHCTTFRRAKYVEIQYIECPKCGHSGPHDGSQRGEETVQVMCKACWTIWELTKKQAQAALREDFHP